MQLQTKSIPFCSEIDFYRHCVSPESQDKKKIAARRRRRRRRKGVIGLVNGLSFS